MSAEDSPKVATRRKRLRSWIQDRFNGSRKLFLEDAIARGYQLDPTEVSNLQTGKKSFGEKKAEQIEKAAGMPPGYLSSDAPAGAADKSHSPSQPGRPDVETLRRAMRLLSFVSQMQAAPIDFSEDADALLAAYDIVSLKPSDFDLEDASKRMAEFFQARRSDGRVDGRDAVGPRRKAARKST